MWQCDITGLRYKLMTTSKSRTVDSKTHITCPLRTTNIGPIGPLWNPISSLDPFNSQTIVMKYHAWFQRSAVPVNGGAPTTYIAFQESKGLFYLHNKSWTHQPSVQFLTIPCFYNWDTTELQHCKLTAFQSSMHSSTCMVFPTYTFNIGPIDPCINPKPSLDPPLDQLKIWNIMHDFKELLHQ